MRLGACRNGWPANQTKRKRRAENDWRGGLDGDWQPTTTSGSARGHNDRASNDGDGDTSGDDTNSQTLFDKILISQDNRLRRT